MSSATRRSSLPFPTRSSRAMRPNHSRLAPVINRARQGRPFRRAAPGLRGEGHAGFPADSMSPAARRLRAGRSTVRRWRDADRAARLRARLESRRAPATEPSRRSGAPPAARRPVRRRQDRSFRPAGLRDADRPARPARQMRCLAEAIYFEARSEPEAGQAAVAQVVSTACAAASIRPPCAASSIRTASVRSPASSPSPARANRCASRSRPAGRRRRASPRASPTADLRRQARLGDQLSRRLCAAVLGVDAATARPHRPAYLLRHAAGPLLGVRARSTAAATCRR